MTKKIQNDNRNIKTTNTMTQSIKKYLNDSFAARWTALVLVASMMFFAYMFVDVLSPLSTLLETSKGWSAESYGTFCSSEYFLNVFAFFLIFAGIILDKLPCYCKARFCRLHDLRLRCRDGRCNCFEGYRKMVQG